MTRPDPGPVFLALADPTRRELFRGVVADGPMTATELAADRDISRQAVAKHLEVLGRAGLVEGRRAGREVRYGARTEPLDGAIAWMRDAGTAWDRRLDRLARLADAPGPPPGHPSGGTPT
jgi:ArsR family transcriptional regulator, cadmium/lead-responsive transcriptional repressor